MNGLIFCFNITAVALSFSSLTIAFISSVRKRNEISFLYLVYQSSFIIFSLNNLFCFFMSEYLNLPFDKVSLYRLIADYSIAVIAVLFIPEFFRCASQTLCSLSQKVLQQFIIGLLTVLLILAVSFREYHEIDYIGDFILHSYLIFISVGSILNFNRRPVKITPAYPVIILYIFSFMYILHLFISVWLMLSPYSASLYCIRLLFIGLKLCSWTFITIMLLSKTLFEQDSPSGKDSCFEIIHNYSLTSREAEIALCIVDGLKNQDIAEKLYISPRTVENHIYNIYRKCSVDTKLQLYNLFTCKGCVSLV